MIISEKWLREWVSLELSANEIADRLTHAGLEVDGVQALAGQIDNLVVGRVLEVEKHPDADRLSLTKVDVGGEPLQIVCGASNVRANLLVAVAQVGAKLPNGLKIKKAKVRGVESNGMLCSASELGLEEQSDGILELGDDAQIGQRVDEYLALDDNLIDIDLTPNRGDCLSVLGIARELKFLADGEMLGQLPEPIDAQISAAVDVKVENPERCPRYLARLIKGVNCQAATPIWMAERLRRSGVRPISAVVDITNYVMLELGQPMHAFDHAKLNDGIVVRMAKVGEKITLLDDSVAELDEETLVIADHQNPIAIAGVMGGADSAISDATQDIVLESAHFTRKSAAGCARRYGLHTESSHRYERGVDPQLPALAMARASQLIIDICGGELAQVCEQSNIEKLADKPEVELRLARLEQLLGMELVRSDVSQILSRIVEQVQDTTTGWRVTPPSYRFDIEYEADLVEEVARVKGYDQIPTAIPRIAPRSMAGSEVSVSHRQVRQTLVAREFREAITYSFIAREQQAQFSTEPAVQLANPLAENMSVMRTSLLPGLLQAAQFNHNRQHGRIRLFEIGASYHLASNGAGGENANFRETQKLAAVITGERYDPQWASASSNADFYDLKADLEAVLSLTGYKEPFIFNEFEHIALHPGQIASISSGDQAVGLIGRLHPKLENEYGFSNPVFVFEVDLDTALRAKLPSYQTVSKFPSIRRDLSLVVESSLQVDVLLRFARANMGNKLTGAKVFDVYQGTGVADGFKSISISLTLQDSQKTLTDEEAEVLVDTLIKSLGSEFGATLRE